MADFDLYFDKLLKWEGGWSDDEDDKGGKTKYGVILTEWIAKGYDKDGDGDIDATDLSLITKEDAARIAKTYYWDKLQADNIHSQSIAELLCDFAYNSGPGTAAIKLQRILRVKVDGIVGKHTLRALNESNPEEVFNALKQSRLSYVQAIVRRNPTQIKFLKGWKNRIEDFHYIT